ncbi:efflux RND transporter permease subunit [Cupriavidus basilensis]
MPAARRRRHHHAGFSPGQRRAAGAGQRAQPRHAGRTAVAGSGAPWRHLCGPGQQQAPSCMSRWSRTAASSTKPRWAISPPARCLLPMLCRLHGIGKAEPYGSEYALRIWFDPDKLNAYGLTAADVEQAIRARNGDVTPGQLGSAPAVPGQPFQALVRPPRPLSDPEAFERIVVRGGSDASLVRLRDVASGWNWAPATTATARATMASRGFDRPQTGRWRQCAGHFQARRARGAR